MGKLRSSFKGPLYLSLLWGLVFFSVETLHADSRNHSAPTDDLQAFSKKVCPLQLAKKIAGEDKEVGLFSWLFQNKRMAKSVAELCETMVPAGFRPSNSRLEELMESNPVTQLNEPLIVNSCLAKLANEVPGFDANTDGRALISEYRYLSNRFQLHYRSNLEALASIDQITGDRTFGNSTTKEIMKQEARLPGSDKWIEELGKTCKNEEKIESPFGGDMVTPKFAELMRESAEGYSKLWKIQKELQRYHAASGYAGITGKITVSSNVNNYDYTRELNSKKEAIFSQYPWLKNERFEKLMVQDPTLDKPDEFGIVGPSGREWQAALNNYFNDKRKALMAQLPEIAKQQGCLNDTGVIEEGCVDKAREFVKKSPELPTEKLQGNIDEKMAELTKAFARMNGKSETEISQDPEIRRLQNLIGKEIAASSSLTEGECRTSLGESHSRVAKIQSEFFENVAITIGTVGLGSIVAGGRAAVAAGRLANLSKGAQIARAAMVGLDFAYASRDVKTAIESCGNTVAQPDFSKVDMSKSGSLRNPPMCSNADQSKQIEYLSEYKSCFTSALTAGLLAVPVLAGNLSAFAPVVSPQRMLSRSGKLTSAQADELVSRIRAKALPSKPGISQRALDAQHAEAFKLANSLVEAGIYKPGMAGAADVEKAIAQMQDLFPGASRFTGGPKLNTEKAMKLFQQFADPKTPNAVAGVNEVLGRALKKLNDKPYLGIFNDKHAKQAINEAIAEVNRDLKLGLSNEQMGNMGPCIHELIVSAGQ